MKVGPSCRHPIQYHNPTAGINPWKKVLFNYFLPVSLLAVVTNLSKFLELETRYHEVTRRVVGPDGEAEKLVTVREKKAGTETEVSKKLISRSFASFSATQMHLRKLLSTLSFPRQININATIYPMSLRLNPLYVLWYKNVAQLTITSEDMHVM